MSPMGLSPHEPAGRAVRLRALYDGALEPDAAAYSLRHLHDMLPVRQVSRAPSAAALAHRKSPLARVSFRSGGLDRDLDGHLRDHRVTGFLVLHRGEIAYETYALGADETSLFTSMSMAKSITTTLVGAALHDGSIGSLDDLVTRYVTELADSAYADVPLRDLLRMRSGVGWNETYTDPSSDRRRMLEAQLANRPGGIIELMARLPRVAPSGTRFNYSTGETHVVGALVRAAVGEPLADYLSRTIWAPCGMEADALWALESTDGLEIGGSGLAVTLRDLARFGEFVRADGTISGARVVPAGYLAEATAAGPRDPGDAPYGFMWWPIDTAAYGDEHTGAFQASGIFGQHLYIHPAAEVVIAQTAALALPTGAEPYPEEDCFGAVVGALRSETRMLASPQKSTRTMPR